jgi:CPA1 family monovalent cation:H+ antiporter
VLLSTTIVGLLTYFVFGWLGVHIDLLWCFTFGALISPTDPTAVMGLLKDLNAPKSLEAKIGGESLFNDGVGVVVFVALASFATASEPRTASQIAADLGFFALREVGGGLALGLAAGWIGYRALKSIDNHPLELLITLALVMFVYSTSFWIHVSGPLSVVAAGLLIGHRGRRFAMSTRTREHVDAFWNMMDQILNAVLFLLLGLEIFAVASWSDMLLPALAAVPICLLARFMAVGVSVQALRVKGESPRGLVPILTWSGLRGGISIALALSLQESPAKEVLLGSTYAVVVFTVLVQGMTVRSVLAHYGFGRAEAR